MRIALALGGGAGLGWVHIGALRALDDAEIAIGAMAGTSIGGVAAVGYAAGRLDTLEELAHSVSAMRRVVRYLGPSLRPGSMLSGKAIARLIDQHLGDLAFEDLAIPSVVVAADLVAGESVVIGGGPVAAALHATIAIPGIFPPVRRGDRLLIDGGALMPVPVSPVRAIAPDLPIVAINLQGDYLHRRAACGIERHDQPRLRAIGVIRAATGLFLSHHARLQIDLDPPDLEIAPAVGHIETSNFTRAGELIEIGRRAIEEALPRIRALAR